MGQWANMPPRPYWLKESVNALMKVATNAHRTEVAAPRRAARRTGEPREPSSASTPAAPAVATTAVSQASPVGCDVPPPGSDMAMKAARQTHVAAAAPPATAHM